MTGRRCHPAVPADDLPGTPSARLCGRCNGLLPRIASLRPETDPCQRGTVGCAINHDGNEECETW